jgi:hypothetical protein
VHWMTWSTLRHLDAACNSSSGLCTLLELSNSLSTESIGLTTLPQKHVFWPYSQPVQSCSHPPAYFSVQSTSLKIRCILILSSHFFLSLW